MMTRKKTLRIVVVLLLLIFSVTGCAGSRDKIYDNVVKLNCPYQLKQISMCDDNTGFGISTDNEILFTTNGVENFVPIKKIENINSMSEGFLNAAFIDEQTAYVAYLSEDNKNITVEYTDDGGNNWHQSLTEYDEFLGGYDALGSVYIGFSDNKNGYLLYCSSPAAGLMSKLLFYTTDAGKSFSYVKDLSAELTGYPQGIVSVDKDTAYIAVTYHGEDNYLYRSFDGGMTWASMDIDMKKKNLSYIDGCVPVFYGEERQSGTLLLKTVDNTVSESAVSYTVCTTSDGGEHWTKQGILSIENLHGYTAANQNKFWFLDEEGNVFEVLCN